MKLLTFPEPIHWSETREFKLLNDDEQEQLVRIVESSNGTSVFVKKAGTWYQSDDTQLINWIQSDLETEELRLDFEQREHAQLKLENEKNNTSDLVTVDSQDSSTTN